MPSTLWLVLLFLELLLRKRKLFLGALDFIHQLLFVKGLFTDDLALEVLYLRIESLFNRVVLFSHDLTPDRVKFVEDLTDAGFTHVPIELIPDLEDGSHGLSRDPVIVLLFLGPSGTFSFRPTLRRFAGGGG